MEARRQLQKLFVGVAEQQPPPKGHTEPLGIAATMFLPDSAGFTRQEVSPKQLGQAMRGQAQGCQALQRVVTPLHSSSVYRNTYELEQGAVHAKQYTQVVSNTLPGIGRKGLLTSPSACRSYFLGPWGPDVDPHTVTTLDALI